MQVPRWELVKSSPRARSDPVAVSRHPDICGPNGRSSLSSFSSRPSFSSRFLLLFPRPGELGGPDYGRKTAAICGHSSSSSSTRHSRRCSRANIPSARGIFYLCSRARVARHYPESLRAISPTTTLFPVITRIRNATHTYPKRLRVLPETKG